MIILIPTLEPTLALVELIESLQHEVPAARV